MTHCTLGVDISKNWLDVHLAPNGETNRFSNDQAGFQGLLRWLDGQLLHCVVYEPTGRWHRDLEQALSVAALPLARVNPWQARRFAQALGKRAKTDALDAGILAQMGMALELREMVLASPQQRQLRELNLARWTLVQDRIAAKHRRPHLHQRLLQRQCQTRLRQIQRDLTTLEVDMAALIQSDPALRRRDEILNSIPGIGSITSSTVLAELPEIGTLESREVASLAGVAPMTRESETWKGRSFTQGGRSRLRLGLDMAALVASRHNPDLSAKYQQLLATGKPPKLALTAIMRKLIILANTLVKQDRTGSPDHPATRH